MNTKQAIRTISGKQFAVEQKKDAGPLCWDCVNIGGGDGERA